jgi:hypothetical protein
LLTRSVLLEGARAKRRSGAKIIVDRDGASYDFVMFTNPMLRELEYLHGQGSMPEHGLFGDNTCGIWFDRFKNVTRLALGLSDDKKAIEANHLVRFALSFSGFPDGDIVSQESPDFIVTTESKRIGIELCDVYAEIQDSRPKKEQEVLQEKIVLRSHTEYLSHGRPPVTARFGFHHATSYGKRDIDRIASHLAKWLPASLAKNGELEAPKEEDAHVNQPQGLAWVLGCTPKWWETPEGRWEVGNVGPVWSSEEFLQAALDAKEKKIDRYRMSGRGELWVLLVIKDLTPSGFLREPMAGRRFISSFDRVFAFWVAYGKSLELSVERQTPVPVTD